MKEKYWTLIFVVIALVFAYFFSHSTIGLTIISAILILLLFLAFRKNV